MQREGKVQMPDITDPTQCGEDEPADGPIEALKTEQTLEDMQGDEVLHT